MEKVGIFYDYLENITAIWFILWQLDSLVKIWYIPPPPVLVYCVKKNLATPIQTSAFR
jgi:hypothetical protein